MESKASRLFSWWQIIVCSAVFVGFFRLAQVSLRRVCSELIPFDCPYYWPISIFEVRFPTVRDFAVAIGTVIAFYVFFRILEHKRFNIWLISLFAVLLIAGTTLIQGVAAGFYAPVAGYAQNNIFIAYSLEGQEYFHDALTITDPVDFFSRYNEIQTTLHNHGQTHPPGAVLTYYFLNKLLGDPALIALFIMIVATIPTVYFSYRLMRSEIGEETARYMAFLVALLPAVQIYYLATLDAIIVALLTGVLFTFCFGRGRRAVGAAAVMLSLSFLLTYVSLFILPVLVGFDLIVRRSLKRSFVTLGIVLAFHLLLYLLSGYDAWHSFRAASLYENPNGFMLFVDPWNYLFTRLEDVAEIVFFFGPFLSILVIRGLREFGGIKNLTQRPLMILTILGCTSLLGMYVVGAWRTGETARACAFIYPYLLFPVAYYLEDSDTGFRGRLELAALVFLQSVGMQVVGNYHW